MIKRLKVTGLDCGYCAAKLEERLNAEKGIQASVDFARQTIKLDYAAEEDLAKAEKEIEKFENVRIVRDGESGAWRGHTAEIIEIIFSALCLVAGIVTEYFAKGKAAQIAAYVLYASAYVTVGWKIIWETIKNIAHGKFFDENFLMTLASVGAIVLGQYAEAAEVMVLYALGELLQSVAVGASRKSIAALMDLKSESATIVTAEGEKEVPPEEIRKGDVLLVKAGEKLAADGVVVEGTTSLDTRSLSGEAMPRDVSVGDSVLGGSINAGGVIKVRAEKNYAESTVAKILDLVENSSASKAKSERFITKFAKIYTPAVCAAALLVAFLAPVFTGDYLANLGDWINRALVFLVISCPCALVISVPLSYFSGIGFAAKHGILVKGSTGLDSIAAARVAAFDKTGTLTYGNFELAKIHADDAELFLQTVAAAEKKSSHPIAEAFRGIRTPYEAKNVSERAGYGLECEINGKKVLVGNEKWMKIHSVAVRTPCAEGTVIYAASDGEYLGSAEIGDRIKENAQESVAKLRKQGVQFCYMLTGDSKLRAERVAEQVGLDGTHAGLLPEDKLKTARELKKCGKLMYVGDGINDAPVLMEADVGVSMGGVGSDAAIEASDVVLMRDDLALLPQAKRIARRTRRIVMENIVFSIAIKAVVMVLGLCDMIPLGLAVFADVGVMMLAVLNSFRTRLDFYKKDDVLCRK